MNKEDFAKEQTKLSKEDIIANYWYTYQDNVEKLGIEHQLNLKDKKIEILEENNKLLLHQKQQLYEDLDMLSERIDKAIEYIEKERAKDEEDNFIDLYLDKYENDLLQILKGDNYV